MSNHDITTHGVTFSVIEEIGAHWSERLEEGSERDGDGSSRRHRDGPMSTWYHTHREIRQGTSSVVWTGQLYDAHHLPLYDFPWWRYQAWTWFPILTARSAALNWLTLHDLCRQTTLRPVVRRHALVTKSSKVERISTDYATSDPPFLCQSQSSSLAHRTA